MCEKNLERKQLSLFPNDEDDILEETIVDNDIDDDSLITDDTDNIIVSASKRKKRSKKKKVVEKICKTCGRDIIKNENRDMLRFTNTYHQLSAKNYCDEHIMSHKDHSCKPSWCGDCGFLMKYEIVVKYDK